VTIKHLTIPEPSAKDIERFLGYVSPQIDGCWYWLSGTDKDGYGIFKMQGKSYRASRIAYFIYTGEDPGPLEVCHSCDNPPCVRDHHFFLGTTKENAQDKMRKGRFNPAWNLPEHKARGSRVNTSKLSEHQAVEAIQRLKNKERQVDIAHDFGVARASIWAIDKGKNWKHLPR
jgi:hypothetical protein